MKRREFEQEAIARFLAAKGITKCPDAFAAPTVMGRLSPDEERRRIKNWKPAPEPAPVWRPLPSMRKELTPEQIEERRLAWN
jgi:hypothetical protein